MVKSYIWNGEITASLEDKSMLLLAYDYIDSYHEAKNGDSFNRTWYSLSATSGGYCTRWKKQVRR